MRKLGRLLAFVAILSMGMPPAWCCAWPARLAVPVASTPVDAPLACPHCCPKPESKPLPSVPIEPCCCVVDDSQVGAVERPAVEFSAAPVWHLAGISAGVRETGRVSRTQPNIRASGPPLHVWNCVFTC